MTRNKKIIIGAVCLVLNLVILGCHIPFLSQTLGTQEAVDQESSLTSTPESAAQEKTPDVNIVANPTQAQKDANTNEENQVYKDNGVEITLPGDFVLGNADQDLETLLSPNNENGGSISGEISQFKDDIVLWGYDAEVLGEQETSFLVIKNEQYGGIPLTIISTFAERFLGSQVELMDQQRLKLEGRDVLRLVTSTANMGVKGSQVTYLFNEVDNLWIIGFFTISDQLESQMKVFDNAVSSFTIVGNE